MEKNGFLIFPLKYMSNYLSSCYESYTPINTAEPGLIGRGTCTEYSSTADLFIAHTNFSIFTFCFCLPRPTVIDRGQKCSAVQVRG